MKVLLLLGCGFVLLVAGSEDVQDSETTTGQSNATEIQDHSTDQTTTLLVTDQYTPITTSTTSTTVTEESTTTTLLITTPDDTTLASSTLHEESLTQRISSTAPPEGEGSVNLEVTSTVTPTIITTSVSASTAVVSTSIPPHLTSDTEATGVPQTSFSSTSESLGDSTPAAASPGAEGGMDLHSTTTAIVPPTTSTQNSTEQVESTETPINTIVTTTIATTTKTTYTPTIESTVATTDTIESATTTTSANDIHNNDNNDNSTTNTTSDVSTLSEASVVNTMSQSSGVCFGKTEVNTMVVVAVVVAVNIVAVVLTALCVHRLVSRRLSWDPPPIYRNRSTRSEKGDKRKRGSAGRNLASDKDCKSGEGEGQTSTNIPIIITNEDGWCVPYSNQTQEERKNREKGSTTEDTGV